ncbi:uncharacterized protein F4812DRAFT_188219 [Daldinia caldariorum]|uniref:uncharacterized protein n=1 Tax=Daldinia caldariorum TaxID=326644 RepID=UPI002008927F|nr:uncharacterized protein F4812DRAFT_188219 [Daldinia caldariorum]KAI1471671.1 hypothetical protein F4812DRAFT_188219 [Daldinia caldariorum]
MSKVKMARGIVSPYISARCSRSFLALSRQRRRYTTKAPHSSASDSTSRQSNDAIDENIKSEPGPMSRRLEEATEEALLTGGTAGRRSIEHAGFSDELKERLLAKVKDAEFRSENAAAFAEAGMPSAASVGTRLTATSQSWTGTEATEDAVLRMLNDAHKPLKRELRARPNRPDLQPIDMRIRQELKMKPGHRAASARDKASIYAGMGMKELPAGLSEEEREELRKEFRERFRPAARALPNSLTGLASLANERIEDAIARGQFKNIPRGKGVERDTRSDNPFVDTTEYIMNKMIKRQEIVPPWIEKQQELAKAAHVFRARLRSEWRRHASRMIASKGGSLEDQINRAKQYAKAEELHNPRKRNVDQIAVPTNSTDDPVMAKMRQQAALEANAEPVPKTNVNTATDQEITLPPFRDPDWLATEQAYMDLSIRNLNSLTRSYNLMAPDLAKKPYFSLERELNNCYADVAPQLADTIKDRASGRAKPLSDGVGNIPGGILDRFGKGGHTAKVYESKAPYYGFKEMWRDFWSRQAS